MDRSLALLVTLLVQEQQFVHNLLATWTLVVLMMTNAQETPAECSQPAPTLVAASPALALHNTRAHHPRTLALQPVTFTNAPTATPTSNQCLVAWPLVAQIISAVPTRMNARPPPTHAVQTQCVPTQLARSLARALKSTTAQLESANQPVQLMLVLLDLLPSPLPFNARRQLAGPKTAAHQLVQRLFVPRIRLLEITPLFATAHAQLTFAACQE